MALTYKGYGGVDYSSEKEAEISLKIGNNPDGQCSDAYGTYLSQHERAEAEYNREHPHSFF